MVVRDTFLAELKTLFGLVVAGFEPGFSDPKAHAKERVISLCLFSP